MPRFVTRVEIEGQKKENLFNIYEHIHREMTEFRSQVLRILVVFFTFTVIVSSWIMTHKLHPLPLSFILVFFLTNGIIIFFYILGLQKYFDQTAQVLHKIECIWGAFEENYFAEEFVQYKNRKNILFPAEWEEFGVAWSEPMFRFSKIVVVSTCFFFFILCMYLMYPGARLLVDTVGRV